MSVLRFPFLYFPYIYQMPSPFMYHKIFMAFPVTYDIDLCQAKHYNELTCRMVHSALVTMSFTSCFFPKYKEKKVGNGSFNHLKAMANLLENFGLRSEIVIT